MAAYVRTAWDSLAVRSHEELLLPKMLELCHPDDSHQWLLELWLTGGAASQRSHLPEADVEASMALLEELEEVMSTLYSFLSEK